MALQWRISSSASSVTGILSSAASLRPCCHMGRCALPGELQLSGCRIKQLWISHCKTEIPPGNSEQSAPSAAVQSLVGFRIAAGGFSPLPPVCHLNYVCVPSLISLFPNERQRWNSKICVLSSTWSSLGSCVVPAWSKVEDSSLGHAAIWLRRPWNKEWHLSAVRQPGSSPIITFCFLKSSSPPYLCFLFLNLKKSGRDTELWSQSPGRIINTNNEEDNLTRTRSLLKSLILFIIGN